MVILTASSDLWLKVLQAQIQIQIKCLGRNFAHSDSWADSSCPDSLYPGRLICERLLSGLFLENNTFSLLQTSDSINKTAAPRELPSVTSKFRMSSQLLHKILWKKLKIIPVSIVKWLFSLTALVGFFWSPYQLHFSNLWWYNSVVSLSAYICTDSNHCIQGSPPCLLSLFLTWSSLYLSFSVSSCSCLYFF